MNQPGESPSRTAAQLRQAFDQSFAEAALPDSVSTEDFLAIRLAADPHALRLTDIANLQPWRTVTPFPSPLPALLGVIGFRGAVVPVYDLRRLLGYASTEPPRWLVISAACPIALAFDAFDGHLRLPRETTSPHARADHSSRHVQELLHGNDVTRPVVSMASVLETIKAAVQQATP